MIIDIDGIFEEYLKKYMKDNAGKYTEKEWEDKMPFLYSKFRNTPLSKLKGLSPMDYYRKMSAEELVETLSRHVESGVAVPVFLCDSISENTETEKHLLKLIDKETDEELFSYAINMLEEKNSILPLKRYLEFLNDEEISPELKEIMTEILTLHAKGLEDELIAAYRLAEEENKRYFIETLANCNQREEIFSILKEEYYLNPGDTMLFCQYFVKYGDERAVEILLKETEREYLTYPDFTELKYAIEALGGEYNGTRDFSNDKYYRKIKK